MTPLTIAPSSIEVVVKLSAPPPPPPPPEQPAPGEQPAPDPNDPNANAPETPPAEVPPTDAPAPAPAPRPLQWPGWYGGVDGALAGLVLLFAFAAASFVARNSDVWLHLAAGQRLFAEYTPGSDPFSYTGADRTWVNHSWLLDGVSYRLYLLGSGGKLLVIVKALLVMVAFGLLIGIRRPKHALWPWVVVACVGVLAAAPQFTLRPLVVSILFLSVLMFLLFRVPHKPNSWRFPVAVGVLFWFWANCDQWFFIGPLALALVAVGELIQTKLLKTPAAPAPEGAAPAEGAVSAPPEEDEPLGALPDLTTLAKALAVGVLACMLNPHHIRVWELPFELVGAPGADADPKLKQLLYSPLSTAYASNPRLGYNLNGLCSAILFVLGAALLGFGYGRVRAAHVALWLGFAALSLLSVAAIPFFVVVAVPLVASQLNALSTRVELKTWGDPKSRVWLIGSSIGRIVSVVAICVLCVIAYPGWAHPETANLAYARRVAWGVEPDPSLVRSAEQIQQWRESGKLPADARGVITNVELANHVAWFAPREKVFFNGRYNHHRPELGDVLAVRRGLTLFKFEDDRLNLNEATAVLKKAGAEYLVIQAGPVDGTDLQDRAANMTVALYRGWADWSVWHVDGRATIFGWRPAGKPTFAALRAEPAVEAFGPDAARLPAAPLLGPPPELGWEEPFVRPLRPAPAGADEARAWLRFKVGPQSRIARRQFLLQGMTRPLYHTFQSSQAHYWLAVALDRAEEAGALPLLSPGAPGPRADAAAAQAAPFLALRAVRRAIAEDPDHPEPYFVLAAVLSDPDLPFDPTEQRLGQIAALRQCLERLPKPAQYRRGQFTFTGTEVAYQLARLYLGQPLAVGSATQKQQIKGFFGVPVAAFPLNLLLGQVVFDEDGRGKIRRVMRAELESRRVQPPLPAGARALNPDTLLYLPLDAAHKALETALAYAAVDLADRPAGEVKDAVQEIEAYRDAAQGLLRTARERYVTATRAGRPLRELIDEALFAGLADEALDLLTKREADLRNEYKGHLPIALAQRVSLELVLGRSENAANNAAKLGDWSGEFGDLKITPWLHALRYQAELLVGNYKAAGEALEASDGPRVAAIEQLKLPPLGPTVPKRFVLEVLPRDPQVKDPERVLDRFILPPPPVPFQPYVQPLSEFVWLETWHGAAAAIRQMLAAGTNQVAEFYLRRGTMSLIEGDIPAARDRFLQARREPPPGWNLTTYHPPNAARYLQLIDYARERAPKK